MRNCILHATNNNQRFIFLFPQVYLVFMFSINVWSGFIIYFIYYKCKSIPERKVWRYQRGNQHWRRTCNTMAKRKRRNRQIMVPKILHRKIRTTNPMHYKTDVIACAPEGKQVPASLQAHVFVKTIWSLLTYYVCLIWRIVSSYYCVHDTVYILQTQALAFYVAFVVAPTCLNNYERFEDIKAVIRGRK